MRSPLGPVRRRVADVIYDLGHDDNPGLGMNATAPAWIETGLRRKLGRDPLGFQTTTQDRLMPVLLPDLLELSRRARYFSFYAFLLQEYERRKLPAKRDAFSRFVLQREYELGLAVLRCDNCESAPVGAQRLRPVARNDVAMFERGESVESANGGYGLYYRSPMIAFDVVAPAGTPLGEVVTTVDVLTRRDAVQSLAETFRQAVSHTDYYQQYFHTSDAIPAEVIDAYATAGCLCRLQDHPAERAAIRDTILTAPQPQGETEVTQRRRAVAHYLSLLDKAPGIVDDEEVFRVRLWDPPQLLSDTHRDIADQWAALVAKDTAQEAFCSIWTHFNRASRQAGGLDGLDNAGLRAVTRQLCRDEPALDPDAPAARELQRHGLPDAPESLRQWTVEQDTATSGMLVLHALAPMLDGRESPAWKLAANVASAWQPSLLEIRRQYALMLESDPTLEQLLGWLIRKFVISAHERIAYSKLPDFTFRFRSGPDGLRFYDLESGRFILAAIRHRPLASLALDLGYWENATAPRLTSDGRAFMTEVLA